MVQARLLDIAVREFGQKGLEGASTRAIAKAAGTVMSSITYHYGGKEGLYLAAADHIAEQMSSDMAAEAEVSDALDLIDSAQARENIHRIIGHFVDKMIGERTADWSLFIMREQLVPTEAFERIYGGLMGQMMERIADLVCIASGRADAEAARVATITLISQAIVLRAGRASCLKLLRRPSIDAEAAKWLQHRIHANIDAILDTLTAERQEPQ